MLTYAEYAPLANVLPPSHKRFFRRITGFNNLSSEFRTEYELEDDPNGSSFCDAGGKRGLASGGYWGKLEVENEICGEVWHINYGLGERIRRARVRAGLTQSQLAEMIGMTNKHLSTVERGMFELHADAVRQISEVLGVSADYLIFDERRNSPLDEALLKAHLLPEEVQDEAADVIEAFMAIQMARKEVAKEDSSDEE